MTAQELITNLSNTSLVGQKISDLTVAQNTTTLLALLNMAKDKIAEDTLLWLGGETISMVAGTSTYTLSKIPIQIIDAYDDSQILRPRNSPDSMGYYQTSPNALLFNTITNGTDVYINYHEQPTDYLIGDTIFLNGTLLSAMQFYIAHKAFEVYKTDISMFSSKEYYTKYQEAISGFMKNSDSSGSDTIVSADNKIYKRGIR